MRKRLSILLISLFLIGIAATVTQSSAQPIDFTWQCDIVTDNLDTIFYNDEMRWNTSTYEWMPPLYWELYWNNVTLALDAPPIENQIGTFNFILSTSHNATKVAAMYGNIYPSPSGFLGDWVDYYVNHSSWLATNGIVLNTTGPYQTTDSISGIVDSSMWSNSGWYKISFFGSYLDGYYDYGSVSWHSGVYFFYLNITLDDYVEPESLPQDIPIEQEMTPITVVRRIRIPREKMPIRSILPILPNPNVYI